MLIHIYFLLTYTMEKSTESIVLTKNEKEQIIKDVYNDEKLGYGSIKDTYQQAH